METLHNYQLDLDYETSPLLRPVFGRPPKDPSRYVGHLGSMD